MGANRNGTEKPSLLGRRRFLAGVSVGSLASLAGCGEITTQSFEATSVGLSSSVQERLQLTEAAREALTREERTAGGNVSVSITSHTAVYSRAGAIGGR
jgi:hypothetical protein